ncbi:hypothetical protein (plasmid) [Metabacillus dongyingensis]|nr:hypothetical protein [Metabacillus dongyingensis]
MGFVYYTGSADYELSEKQLVHFNLIFVYKFRSNYHFGPFWTISNHT